jgi:hypothetical protein
MTFVSKAFADTTVRMAFDKSVIWAGDNAARKNAKVKLGPARPTRVQDPVGADLGAGHDVSGATRVYASASSSSWTPRVALPCRQARLRSRRIAKPAWASRRPRRT